MNEKLKTEKLFHVLLIALAVFGAMPAPVFSQEMAATAFLDSGPLERQGMPGIGLNSIPGFMGVYRVVAAGNASVSDTRIKVYYTDREIPFFSTWEIAKPGVNNIYRTPGAGIYIYSHFGNWTVFIDFGTALTPDERDLFAENFIDQMIFFARDGSGFTASSFPAVIELEKD